MSTHTYSVNDDFPTDDVNTAQLQFEVESGSISATVTSISQSKDVIKINFQGTLVAGEITALGVIVAAHIPNVVFNQVLSTTHVGSGFEYNTIKDAVQYYIDNLISGTIMVHPGTYYEVNPIVLPTRVTIKSFGGAVNTFVVATVPYENIFVLNDNSEINSMGFNSGYLPGVNAAYFDGETSGFATVRDSLFTNLDSCAISENGPGIFMVEEAVCAATLIPYPSTINTCFKSLNGGDLRVFTTGCSGRTGGLHITKGAICSGKNATTDVPSFLLLNSVNVQIATYGIEIDDNARIEMQGCILRYTDCGITIGETGSESDISCNGVSILESNVHDLDIKATDVKNIICTGMRIRRDKINDPHMVGPNISGFSDVPEDNGHMIVGKLNVGTMIHPTTSSFGEGGSSNIGIDYYQNDNLDQGTWTGPIDDIKTRTPSSTPLWGSVASGNCFYIGGLFRFTGFNYKISQLMDLGDGSVVHEYWNSDSSSWVEYCVMVTWGNEPYYTLGQKSFRSDIALSGSRKFYMRFGMMPDWGKSTLDSVEKYWIRFRIVSDIDVVPLIDRMKSQGHTHKISKTGATEYFGNARPIIRLDWDISKASSSLIPGNIDLYISDNISVGRTENLFETGTIDHIGINRFIPADMDTSMCLTVIWSWSCSVGTGDIKWRVRWGSTNDTVVVGTSGDVPTTFENEQYVDVIETVPATLKTQKTTSTMIKFCGALSRPEVLAHPDIMWITLERRGTDGEDTCSGNIYLINTTSNYVKWRNGLFLDQFGDHT